IRVVHSLSLTSIFACYSFELFFLFLSFQCLFLSFPFIFFLMIRPPLRSTLFPYTTLFRSNSGWCPRLDSQLYLLPFSRSKLREGSHQEIPSGSIRGSGPLKGAAPSARES